MRQRRHIFAKLATAWWLVVCLLAPNVAAMAAPEGEGHSCCRKKSDCCCRNRTGKRSAIIGDRAECSRTCGVPALGAAFEAPLAEREMGILFVPAHPVRAAELPWLGLRPLAEVLHQRPPPQR